MSPEEGEEPGGSCSRQVFPGGAWLDVGWAQPLGLAPRTELPMGVRAHGVPVPGSMFPAGSLENHVCLCSWHCCGKPRCHTRTGTQAWLVTGDRCHGLASARTAHPGRLVLPGVGSGQLRSHS